MFVCPQRWTGHLTIFKRIFSGPGMFYFEGLKSPPPHQEKKLDGKMSNSQLAIFNKSTKKILSL